MLKCTIEQIQLITVRQLPPLILAKSYKFLFSFSLGDKSCHPQALKLKTDLQERDIELRGSTGDFHDSHIKREVTAGPNS